MCHVSGTVNFIIIMNAKLSSLWIYLYQTNLVLIYINCMSCSHEPKVKHNVMPLTLAVKIIIKTKFVSNNINNCTQNIKTKLVQER